MPRDVRAGAGDRLELLESAPRDAAYPHPLLFLHGAFTGAWCWAENFLGYFAAQGFTCYALSFRGHGASRGRESLMSSGIQDYVEDVFEAVNRIGSPPVLVGHSMGGFVAQKYVDDAPVPGVALLAPVPPQGLFASQLQLVLANPTLFAELNTLLSRGQASPAAMHKALISGPVEAAKLAKWFRHTQPESQRAIWDMTLFALPWPWRQNRTPLLWLAAENDALMPIEQMRIGAGMLGTSVEVMPGLGHAMMLDAGWQTVADRLITWLRTLK